MKKLSSSELKSAVIGMALGDAYIDTSYKHCRMDIYVKDTYEDFAKLKYNILTQIGNLDVNMKEKIDKRELKNGGVRKGLRIQTKIHPYITKIKNIPLFKKPEMLSELGLAIWYMDDGSLSIRKESGKFATCILAMNRYPLEFVEHMKSILLNNFGIVAHIQKHGNNSFVLRFNKDEAIKLHKIISPYVVESMRYKLLEESRNDIKVS